MSAVGVRVRRSAVKTPVYLIPERAGNLSWGRGDTH